MSAGLASPAETVLRLRQISAGFAERPVVEGFDLDVHAGESVALLGPSGSGKTTVGRVAAGLHPATGGVVMINGEERSGIGSAIPADVRRRTQMIFQSPRRATDPRWTLRRIVTGPASVAGVSALAAYEWAERCGLNGELLDRHPSEVSDGQLQRACVARGLLLRPDLLVCDEVTAMLDAATTAAIIQVIRSEVNARGLAVLAITHDTELAAVWADRTVRLSGRAA